MTEHQLKDDSSKSSSSFKNDNPSDIAQTRNWLGWTPEWNPFFGKPLRSGNNDPQQHQNKDTTMIPAASHPVHSPSYSAPSSAVQWGYPCNIGNQQNNHPQPPVAQPAKDESSSRVVKQDIRDNKNKEEQQIGTFRLQKTVADSLAKGGGVSQIIAGNENREGGQKIGTFETYD